MGPKGCCGGFGVLKGFKQVFAFHGGVVVKGVASKWAFRLLWGRELNVGNFP